MCLGHLRTILNFPPIRSLVLQRTATEQIMGASFFGGGTPVFWFLRNTKRTTTHLRVSNLEKDAPINFFPGGKTPVEVMVKSSVR